jgi:hypothetical protein
MQALRTCASSALQASARRSYSTGTSAYAATAQNLRINGDTKLIYQGFTGRQGTYVSAMPRSDVVLTGHADSMPSRRSTTVGEARALGFQASIDAPRHKCRRRNQPEEGWRDTPGEARLRQRARCRERDRCHRLCYLRPVSTPDGNESIELTRKRPPVAAKGIEEAIEAEIPLVVW